MSSSRPLSSVVRDLEEAASTSHFEEEGEDGSVCDEHPEPLSRHATRGSHLEESWEDVDFVTIATVKSRASSANSATTKRSKKGIFHKMKFSSLFPRSRENPTPPAESSSVSGRATVSDQRTSQHHAHSRPVHWRSNRIEPKSDPQPFPSLAKKPPYVPRMRLSASESEASSHGVDGRFRQRSSTSLGSGFPKLVSPAGSKKELAASRTNKKVLSNRSIGIISGEDFVLNASSNKVADYVNSAWNNLKYGWNVKPKVKLSLKSPIWILGHCYTVGNVDSEAEKAAVYKSFLTDFRSRIWFTYRRELPMFAGTSLTTDSGWGCMLRSGQMMLAQALLCHFLGREWRWKEPDIASREKDVFHRQIIRWCGDTSGHDQLFGLHKLVAVGQKCGKRAGDWYGPASLAHILQKAMQMARTSNPLLRSVKIYVSQDCTIYRGDVLDLRDKGSLSPNDRDAALIILVAVRLGGHRINHVYIPCVKDLMTLRYSIGIIGGRPKHSLYFVGWQDNHFVQLDPHYCQPAVDMGSRGFVLDSFHCAEPRRLAVKSMDPSCTLGFYCRNAAEYEDFVSLATEVQSRYCRDYPIFTFADGKLSDYEKDGFDLKSFEAEFNTSGEFVETSAPASSDNRPVSTSAVDCLLDAEYVVL